VVTDVAGATRDSSHSQLTTTARPEPQPMPAGWPLSLGWQPDLVRHQRRLHVQRPRLQELEAVVVERPFDLDRGLQQSSHLRSMRPSSVAWPGVRHGLLSSSRHRLRRDLAVAAGVAMILAAGLMLRTKPWRLSTMRSGTTSPCAIADPSPRSR
jgi:hypothetical protein